MLCGDASLASRMAGAAGSGSWLLLAGGWLYLLRMPGSSQNISGSMTGGRVRYYINLTSLIF